MRKLSDKGKNRAGVMTTISALASIFVSFALSNPVIASSFMPISWNPLASTASSLTATQESSNALPATNLVREATDNSNAPITVLVTRTDSISEVHVGDRLTFDITYTNNTSRPLTAYPTSTNLSNVITTSTPNCRWANLPANSSRTCSFAYYVVTERDVEEGVQITSQWKATTDREGTQVVNHGENISATVPGRITVHSTPRTHIPDAATSPADRPMGEPVELARAQFLDFACHRIPALTQAPNGDLLAAWDGRPGGCADAPQPNTILQRRSTDGGKSWEMPTVVAAGHSATPRYGYSDPSYVVDRQTGEIFMFFVKSFDQGFQGSRAGTDPADRNVLHAAVTSSKDNGATWSEPRVITASVSPGGDVSRFAASGEGIQIRQGQYAGRIVQQFTVKSSQGVYQAMSVYSDDHGLTWQHGTPVGVGMDENKVVELSDGTLLMNSRASDANRARKVARSADGGQTWSEPIVDSSLIDPRNNASIIRAFPEAKPNDPKAQILLFSNAFNSGSRSNGMIHVSYNNGETWDEGKQFKSGTMAYSTLTPILTSPGTYGLIFEGDHNTINFTKVDLEWLGINPDGTPDQCGVREFTMGSITIRGAELPYEHNGSSSPNNMLDGNPRTIWHSPWRSRISLPLTIDLEVNGDAIAADGIKIKLTPRQSGGNGIFKNYRILVGSSFSDIIEAGSVTGQGNNKPTFLELSGSVKAIRIIVESTYGDVANKFASIAEVSLVRHAPPENCHLVTVQGGKIVGGANTQGIAPSGGMVRVVPNDDTTKKKFRDWEVLPSSPISRSAENGAKIWEFTMPNQDVNLTANFTAEDQNTNRDSGNGSDKNPAVPVLPLSTQGDAGTSNSPGELPILPAATAIRWGGKDRVETALLTWEKTRSKTAYLVGNQAQIDAITAGVPAANDNSGILYTSLAGDISAEVMQALRERIVTEIVVVGGYQAVPERAEKQINDAGIKTRRVGGTDRYETAVILAQLVASQHQTEANVLPKVLVRGDDFADAMVALPLATRVGAAVVLSKNGVLPFSTKTLLQNTDADIYAVGGPAVKASKTLSLSDYRRELGTSKAIINLVGMDRFATSVQVANEYFPTAKVVGVVNESAFADAVVGATYIAQQNGPLLFSHVNDVPKNILETIPENATCLVFGGRKQISHKVMQQISEWVSR